MNQEAVGLQNEETQRMLKNIEMQNDKTADLFKKDENENPNETTENPNEPMDPEESK